MRPDFLRRTLGQKSESSQFFLRSKRVSIIGLEIRVQILKKPGKYHKYGREIKSNSTNKICWPIDFRRFASLAGKTLRAVHGKILLKSRYHINLTKFCFYMFVTQSKAKCHKKAIERLIKTKEISSRK